VLFIMLSNHYPTLYNHPQNWLLLIILGVSGALTRHAMVTKNPVERWTLFPAAIGLGALVFMTAAQPTVTSTEGPPVEFSQVHAIIQTRCITCHSSSPTDDVYHAPPLGVVFESEAQFRAKADKVYIQVVLAKAMPLGNKTHMLDTERATIRTWLIQEKLIQKP
jgi:uncharacterized membrane protein